MGQNRRENKNRDKKNGTKGSCGISITHNFCAICKIEKHTEHLKIKSCQLMESD